MLEIDRIQYYSKRPSIRSVLTRKLLHVVIKWLGGSFVVRGRRYCRKATKWKAPKGYQLDKFRLKECNAEFLKPDNASAGKVILQLHGGAYVIGFNNLYRRNALLLSKRAGNVCVLSIDYRLAPENPFPAALDDAVNAYLWLLSQGYEPHHIIIEGDSAGGGLALATAMMLRDKGIPTPAALVLLSPWTDLPGEGRSRSEKYDADPMFGRNAQGGDIKAVAYTTKDNLKNPYVSPAYGHFKGMPEMLIHVGENEVLLSDSETVAEKARVEGIPVELTIWRGLFHVFQLYYGIVPEAKKSIEVIGAFIKKKLRIE